MSGNEFYNKWDEDCENRVPVMEFNGFGKAYIPFQELCKVYSEHKGFVRGTIFPELDIPYEPRNNNPPKSRSMANNIESMSNIDRRSPASRKRETRNTVKILNENVRQSDRDRMLQRLSTLDFMLLDMCLYLNTHPADNNALAIHKQVSEEAREIRKTYEHRFGPLLGRDSINAKGEWQWSKDPWPWESEANFRIREA